MNDYVVTEILKCVPVHVMKKAYRERRGMDPLILNLGIGRK
jgi:hypothetical protein